MKKLLLSLALLIAAGSAYSAPAVKRIELFKYNLNALATTYFVLDPGPGTAGTALIQATASTTVTAVSGTPFANVSVGDMLIITNSDNVVTNKSVLAKASGASITVSLPAITLSNASFRWRKMQSGTAVTNGGFPVSDYSTLTVEVSVEQLSLASGGINISLECRANPSAAWAPAYPVAVPPAAQVPFNVTAVGSYLLTSIGVYDSCRVALKLTGADDASGDAGTFAEDISIYSLGGAR